VPHICSGDSLIVLRGCNAPLVGLALSQALGDYAPDGVGQEFDSRLGLPALNEWWLPSDEFRRGAMSNPWWAISGTHRRASMPETEPTAELNEEFSAPDAQARPWAEVVDVLSRSEMFWLSTVRGDGRPHVTPLPAIWLDGALHICTGAGEQKAKNLESDPRCILTTGTNQFRSGLDVVVEGTAARVTDTAQLQRLAAMWRSKLDWPFEVADGAFRDTEGHRALVFGIAPTKVLSFGKGEPYSQTRYRFTA
jgi:general stress protein 26